MPNERMMPAVAQDSHPAFPPCFRLGESAVGKGTSWRQHLRRWLLGRRRGLLGLVMMLLPLAFSTALLSSYWWGWHQLRTGRALLERYHPDEARPYLEACLRLRPQDGEVLLLLARAARRANALSDADAYLDQYKRSHGQTEELLLEQVLQRAARGEVEPVAKHCRQRIEQEDAAAPLIFEALTQGYLRLYRLHEGYAVLQEWRKRQPENTQALLFEAGLHVLLRHHPEALSLYERILQLDPEHDTARRRLAVILMEDLRHAEAIPHLQQLCRRRPRDAEAAIFLARCWDHQGEQAEAERLVQEVLQWQPQFAPALFELGKMAHRQGRLNQAESYLRQALSIDAANHPLLYHLNMCLSQNGKTEEAEAIGRRMRQLQAKLNRLEPLTTQEIPRKPRDLTLQHELSEILLDMGQTEEALQWLGGILQHNPRYVPAHRTLANYYQRVGDLQRLAYHRRFLPETLPNGDNAARLSAASHARDDAKP
jgi:tetratricopeptide (TPR) repeat protein